MKKLTITAAAIAAVALLATAPAHAFRKGTCVMPATVKVPNGLKLKNKIPVFKSANDNSPVSSISTLQTFYVEKVIGARVLLEVAPGFDDSDPDPEAGKLIGWVDGKHLEAQNAMNCGM